ncbi:unnamed protein product [Camellia sinensis]
MVTQEGCKSLWFKTFGEMKKREGRREHRMKHGERERERERESSNLCAGNDEERQRKSFEKCKIEEEFKILSRIHQIEDLKSLAREVSSDQAL